MAHFIVEYTDNIAAEADIKTLLAAVNRNVKSLLGQEHGAGESPQSNDGLDAAFFWFDAQSRQLHFSGARIALHVLRPDAEAFDSIAGERMGVGYVDSQADYAWALNTIELAPGSLLFDRKRRFSATVRADGSLLAGAEIGSIHALGAKLQGAPSCNGWTFWHLEHEGALNPLDTVRQKYLLSTEP